ncbi:MAG: polysaccharide biosynthesis tyrosine autokinase [Calditrichaeota bacterium]|nr:MAG: polysaccharide biosynthesis tyrosine autokinase [Calditrichota bacterium]
MNEYNTYPGDGNGKVQSLPARPPERKMTLNDYRRIFFRGRYVVLITFGIILLLTALYTFLQKPVYEANVRLMLQDNSSVGQSLFDLTSAMKQETMLNNQVEILKSRTVAERVIRNLLKSPYSHRLRVLQRPDTLNASLQMLNWLSLDSKKDWSESEVFDEQVKNLREELDVRHIRNTDMMQINFRAHSAFEAYFVANALADVYERISQEESQAEVRQVKEFLEEQLKLYEQELKHSEEQLKSYQESAHVVALDNETIELVQKITDFETLYNSARTDLLAARQRLDYIDSELARQNTNFDIETISKTTALEEFTRKIAEKEAQLAVYQSETIQKGESQFTRRQIETLQRQIDALKAQFKQNVKNIAANQFVDPAKVSSALFTSKIEVETEIRSLEPKVSAFEKILEQYNAELEGLPTKKLQLARLARSAQVAEKLYVMLQEKYQESRITEVGQLGNVRVIDPAKEPYEPILPRKGLNMLLGVLLGLGFGIALAFTMDYMDDSITSMEDMDSLGLPLIATIPMIKPDTTGSLFSRVARIDDPEVNAINERLVTHLKPKSPVSESYRSLRTNILFTAPENPKQVILVTSSGPREGKSTSVANLAIIFAQMGAKTLLIDADLRRPMLHKLFRVNQQPGLTNVLIGQKQLEEAITAVPDVLNLSLLTCGINPPNPAELLGSERMNILLQKMRQEYNMVLIDTPPVNAVTDPSVLARAVDGVILVVRSASTQRGSAFVAVEQLRRVEAPLLGIILNSVSRTSYYGSYYHEEYYYYYTADGEKKHKSKAKSSQEKSVNSQKSA